MTDTTLPAAQDVALAPTTLHPANARTRFFVAFLLSVFVGLIVGVGALYAFDRTYTGRVLPGVTVGGIELAGLTPDEATARLESSFASMREGRAVLTSGDVEMVIEYSDVNRRPDIEGLVSEAMAVGRSGNTVERIILDARTAVRGVDIAPRVLFDKARLARHVQALSARFNVSPQSASVSLTKQGFVITDGVAGKTAGHAAATEALAAELARVDAPNNIRVALELTPIEPEVTTAEATAARAATDLVALDVAIVEGKESWTIPAATVRSWITFSTSRDGTYGPTVDPAKLEAHLGVLAKEIDHKAQNASFKLSGAKITGVIASRNGRSLDIPLTAARVGELLTARAAGTVAAQVAPKLSITPPSLTTEEAQAVIPKMTKISSWTTYFPISERNHFGANIWIPAMDIDGTVVAPGEEFDFWNAVGPISRARGYGDGGAIINGKTEPQGALAGGICSNSTTLFNAVLRAGYEMGARRNHYYYIDRYPVGLDATVFKSGSGSVQTVSWTNDTAYPVLIRGYKIKSGSKGYVRYDIYSVPNGRKVVIGNPTIKNIKRATDTVQYTSSLAPGARKRIEYPVDGQDVWRTITVYQGGQVLRQKTYYSHYSRITGVTLVGR